MTARFLCRFHHFLMTCILTSEFNIILNGICKQIHRLKYKWKITHQTVHAVVLYIHASKRHFPGIHIPKPGDQIAKCWFSSTRWSNNCCRRFLWDRERYIVNDLPFVIGKRNIRKSDVVILRLNLFAVDIHGVQLQYCICFIYTYTYHM